MMFLVLKEDLYIKVAKAKQQLHNSTNACKKAKKVKKFDEIKLYRETTFTLKEKDSRMNYWLKLIPCVNVLTKNKRK